MSALKQLGDFGQSFWIDFIRRNLVTGGDLQKLIREDGLKGMTSNPAIFDKAIRGGEEYTDALARYVREGVYEPAQLYELLALEDIRLAADRLQGVYEETEARDGYVSLEVSPHLANDTSATLLEARRLWRAVARPNLMIKIPGTPAGFPAVETLTDEGINVNVTLLFSHEAYANAARAYERGLSRRAERGDDIGRVSSVASFFVSRIDSAVDAFLDARAEQASGEQRADLEAAKGKVAIAWAKVAYRCFKEVFVENRWRELLHSGARPQRLLWASTSTKNPNYRDVLYVEELIGADTVNTVPPSTIDAFRDHGRVAPTLEQGLDEAKHVLDTVARADISMRQVTDKLLSEGVKQFVIPYDSLIASIAAARDDLL
jgi:transaldolase / glucose-6-phosphate isomerase